MLKIQFIIILTLCFSQLRSQSHWESIVRESDEFRYLLPKAEPTEDWTALNFNDQSWETGKGGFGFGDNDDKTVVAATKSMFLRKKFTLPNSVKVHNLILDIDYDDAFVAYLNGVEIGRSKNLPIGKPGINANVSTDHEAQLYTGGQPERFMIYPGLLTLGSNILAVHILNTNVGSSDMSARIFLNSEIEGDEIIFSEIPDWFQKPVNYNTADLPKVKINTEGKTILDEPKIMAKMQVINNSNGKNSFSDTKYEYDGYIGIEIRGNTSQMFPKKSFSVETRLSDGSNNSVSLLGLPAENDWVFHGPYSDKSLMRNALAYSIGNAMGKQWHPRTRFMEVEINGEYRGIYLLVEKIKIDKNRVDIATLKPEDNSGDELTGGYIISIDRDQPGSWNSPFYGRTGSVDVPFSYVDPGYDDLTPQQRNYIKSHIIEFEYALHGKDFKNPDLGYRAYIDVESFIDYFIITELSRNLDGYRVSVYFHKDKDSKGGKLTMSPFWDYNICFGNANFFSAGNTVGWASDGIGAGDWYEIPFWWDRFREDPYFETVLKYRWEKLREQVLSKNTINSFIDSCQNVLKDAQVRNFEKFNVLNTYVWPNNYIGGTYANEVNYLKSWISSRIDWLDSQIDKIEPVFVVSNHETSSLEGVVQKVYPNPFSDKFSIEFDLQNHAEVTIEIKNLLGQLVCRKQVNLFPGSQTFGCTYEVLGNKGSTFIYRIIIEEKFVKSGIVLHK